MPYPYCKHRSQVCTSVQTDKSLYFSYFLGFTGCIYTAGQTVRVCRLIYTADQTVRVCRLIYTADQTVRVCRLI